MTNIYPHKYESVMNTYRLFNPVIPSQHIVFRTADQWGWNVRVTYLRGEADEHTSPGPYILKHDTPEVMSIAKAREFSGFHFQSNALATRVIHEFRNPLPVTTPMGDGYAIYVRDGGTWENDIFAIVLCDGGRVFHFRSDQIRIWTNATFGIQKARDSKNSD